MKHRMYLIGLVLLALLVGLSHSSNGMPQEVIVQLASGNIAGASVSADCPSVVAWMTTDAPALIDVRCQALRGRALIFRLQWVSVPPAALMQWLSAQQRAGRLVWFEFSGVGLRTQATAPIDFYKSLTAVPRTIDMPSFLSIEQLRLQNLLRIYKPMGLVTVAVIDSGVNFDSTKLKSLRFRNGSEVPDNGIDDDGNGYVDDVSGWDFVDENIINWFDDTQIPDGDPKDFLGHGTAVASIVAVTAGSKSSDWLRVMPLRVASGTNGVGSVSPFALAEAIYYAAAMKVQVINLSVGSSQTYQVVTDAVNTALAQGVQVVVAAGNSPAGVLFPAGLPGVLAVGALDANGQVWSGSARGPEVGLFLRGTDMLSELGGVFSGLSSNGTSYAAPMAAGMAAMLWAVAGDCSASKQAIQRTRPADQYVSTWVSTLVNEFESEVHGSAKLAQRWQDGQGVCSANLTVAALLRQSPPEIRVK